MPHYESADQGSAAVLTCNGYYDIIVNNKIRSLLDYRKNFRI